MSETPRVATAPGRANLIGEHTDYNGGRCLPLALPLRTTATWTPDGSTGPQAPLTLVSEGLGTWRGTLADLRRPLIGWPAYALGALAAVGHDAGGTLHLSSTVPAGAGLSSSAAVICSVLRAVSDLSAELLVPVAIEAETRYAGAPTGGLDQTISLLAEPGQALLLDFATLERRPVPWAPEVDGVHLLVVDSGVSHAHASGGYATRRAECEQARDLLGVEHLAHAAGADVDALPEPLRARARHVVSETARVGEVCAAAARGDWEAVGALFTASHVSLRDDFQVSCVELDTAVDAALSAGALGARMTGGGFGGSVVVLTRDPAAVRSAIDRAFADRGWRPPGHHEARACAGASQVS